MVKGIVTPEDAETCLRLGADGIIVSNHGGRQLDAGQSAIPPLRLLAKEFGRRTTGMMDSGVRSGPDVACAMACGAKSVFMGRSWMYGVAALGQDGCEHTMTMMKRQFRQVLEQLGCARCADLPQHLSPRA